MKILGAVLELPPNSTADLANLAQMGWIGSAV